MNNLTYRRISSITRSNVKQTTSVVYSLHVVSLTYDQASLIFFSRREGTPDTITFLFVCRPLIKMTVSENVLIRMNQAELPEVAPWAGIVQGTNSANLHAVLYSIASYADILRTGHLRSQAQLAIVSKEPILCSVNVDISVICQAVQVCRVLLHCLGSFILHDICFRGAKCGK